MRILFTQDTDWPQRNPGQQHHLAELMQLRGHEVRATDFPFLWRGEGRTGGWSSRQVLEAPAKAHGDKPIELVRPGFIRLPLCDYASYALSLGRELRRQCREFQPDVIVSFGVLSAALSARAAERCGIPFVYYWIDVLDLLLPQAYLRPLCVSVEKYALRKARLVLTINEVLKDVVVARGADPAHTEVVRAGIDTALFTPAAHPRAEARHRLGIEPDDLVLFFMGWLYPFSGVLEVARDVVASAENNLTLVVAGEGDQLEALRQLAVSSDVGHRIRLLGQVPHAQLPGLIAAADACLLPAYRDEPVMQDIVPIKLYEYMAMGKPVIATRLPGVSREFGEDNGMVYVTGPEEVVPTARALANNGTMQALGLRAREFVAYNTWDNVAEQFEELLEASLKETER